VGSVQSSFILYVSSVSRLKRRASFIASSSWGGIFFPTLTLCFGKPRCLIVSRAPPRDFLFIGQGRLMFARQGGASAWWRGAGLNGKFCEASMFWCGFMRSTLLVSTPVSFGALQRPSKVCHQSSRRCSPAIWPLRKLAPEGGGV